MRYSIVIDYEFIILGIAMSIFGGVCPITALFPLIGALITECLGLSPAFGYIAVSMFFGFWCASDYTKERNRNGY